MELYLVRHGESELNKESVYYGHTDCHLTSKGNEQAKEVAYKLKDVSFDYLFSSPLKRARDSAISIKGQRPLALREDGRLMEMNFGKWEGKSYKDIGREEPEVWHRFCYEGGAPPEGENLHQMYMRVKDFLDQLIKEHKNHRVLIVSHQGCLRLILSELMGLGKEGFWHFTFTQGYYSKVQIDETGHCTLLGINN